MGCAITVSSRFEGVVIILNDVTSFRRTETAFLETQQRFQSLYETSKKQEQLYSSLFNTSPDAIMICDLQGRVRYVNETFTLLFGWTLEEIEGSPVDYISDSGKFNLSGRSGEASYVQLPAERFESQKKTADGRTVDVSVSISSYVDHRGNPAGFLVILSDITGRKKAEELLAHSERVKGVADLASGVGHNFKNLLQIVMGGAQMAMAHMELGNFSDARTSLDQILESVRFGSQTVRRLQDFAHSGTDRAALRGKVFDLARTLREAVEMSKPWWKTAAEKDGINISVVRDIAEGCRVKGNENELFEVVVNLIKNATEALPVGGEITVSSRVESNQVVLSVADNGVGIAKENLSKIFEPFWTTKGAHGTGMGLASCFGIIRRHAGDISATSREGRGTTFYVTLPLAEEDEEDARPQTFFTDNFSASILIVDDMQTLLSMLEYGLSKCGQKVYSATSGEQALRVFNETHVDVVVCDLGMPGMNGWQVGRAVKEVCLEKGISKTPFVLLTGWGGEIQGDERIADSGVDFILEKPVMIPKLLKTIHDVVLKDRVPSA